MSEIYIEGRFKMLVFNTDEFGYDDEEVKKFDWEDFAKDEFWNSCDDMGELEDKYDITFHKVQPQLTIPKSVADELEKYDFELTSKGLMYRNMGGTLVEFSRVTYDEIPQLIVQTIAGNYRIVFAYLAGQALGVDLVKVV
ncbi:hypothetical protein [Lactococcus cremoris]|uniref:hypothetical protein n=1 Tax=Lactococcus lactis subsp. cremoris TaxID=1359 RepID=UPI00058338E4|nr:hypothetical protein [Lactococcus cremoris]KGH33974.1 hypothetical protein JL36_04245 [Lactococcus cremoris]QSE64090.1 hypothetical protein JWR96_02905 [Lactococcus cremoris]